MSGPLFEWSNGAALRDRGMAIARDAQERNAPDWSDRYYAAIVRVAHRQPTLFRDDVAAEYPEEPEHPNAAGAVWLRAIRNGLICRSGQFRPSSDPRKHSHQYPVYQSQVYALRPRGWPE